MVSSDNSQGHLKEIWRKGVRFYSIQFYGVLKTLAMMKQNCTRNKREKLRFFANIMVTWNNKSVMLNHPHHVFLSYSDEFGEISLDCIRFWPYRAHADHFLHLIGWTQWKFR